jgi:glycosyltransferase involved in cell wall biosynthesis
MTISRSEAVATRKSDDSGRALITFVIAVFNAVKTLQQCIDSVVKQSCGDFELVVIDGGSGDGSIDILRRNENHFAYWVSEPDRGVYDAWNKALVHAKGEWICFLGADDYLWSEDVVQRLLEKLPHLSQNTLIAYGKIVLLGRDELPMFELGEPWAKLSSQFVRKMCLPHPAVFHRRGLFETYGRFDPSFRIAGDYEFLLRSKGDQTPLFLEDLVVSAMRPGGLSSNPSNAVEGIRELYRAQKKNGLSAPWLSKVLTWVRVYLRLLISKVLGARIAAVVLDCGRRAMGQSAYWTRV